MKTFDVVLKFETPLLGSQPNRDVTSEFIHQKAIKAGAVTEEDAAAELETIPEQVEKATTVFHRADGQPVLWDYQLQGFFKEWAGTLNGLKEIGGVKNFRDKVSKAVFVTPRQIPLEGVGEVEWNERPLRAETMKGPRVALARSEQAGEGTTIHFRVHIVIEREVTEAHLRTILDFGAWKGIGQWRSGGWGRFTYEMTEVA
jgi:hypothetical protein